ncbi:glycoside hydrolase family protein [Pantoea rodasii]|uniref:glycoside hydrolase family protein n=1 Tax=Pantoea rodasii TaxID=1076549 RepID=UPI0012FD2290|nr:hypothetical protein [Pantoea rodasii]
MKNLKTSHHNKRQESARDVSVLKKLNAGDDDVSSRAFGRYIHAGGKALFCLVRRKKAERALFLTRTLSEVSKTVGRISLFISMKKLV